MNQQAMYPDLKKKFENIIVYGEDADAVLQAVRSGSRLLFGEAIASRALTALETISGYLTCVNAKETSGVDLSWFYCDTRHLA